MADNIEHLTGVVRAVMPHLITPKAFDKETPNYRVRILLDKVKNKADIDAIKKIISNFKQSTWKGKVPGDFHDPLIDGDVAKENDELYKGQYFINLKSQFKIPAFDRANTPITDEAELYSGVWIRAQIKFKPYQKPKSGISSFLGQVQKVRDGEELATMASSAFEPIEGDDFDEGVTDNMEKFVS